MATQKGFKDGKQAIEAVDSGVVKPGKLRSFIEKYITSKRSSVAEVKIEVPTIRMSKPLTEIITNKARFVNPDRDYKGLNLKLWPSLLMLGALIPKFGFGKRTVPKTRKIYFEEEVGDPTWVRLHPDALTGQEMIKRHPFWYT